MTNALTRLAAKGFRGWPAATVAYYGPNGERASKVVVAIVKRQGQEPVLMQKWFSDREDVRFDGKITAEILGLIAKYRAKSVAAPAQLLGCPHEEGVDYPEGADCPQCPYWAGKDRWAGIEG